MSLIGWTRDCQCEPDFHHPDGTGVEVPAVELDHYAIKCPNPPFPRTLAAALYDDTQRPRYGNTEWKPSGSGLQACPVERMIKVHNDYIDDPLANRFMLRGTFAHEGIINRIDGSGENWINEKPMVLPLEYDDGLEFDLFGTLDCYYVPERTIFDLKTKKEYPITKAMKQTDQEYLDDPFSGPWCKENIYQLNVYKVMAEDGFFLSWNEDGEDRREKAGLTVDRLELQYFDGQLRFRPFPHWDESKRCGYPMIADGEKMRESIRERARNLYVAVNRLEEWPAPKYDSVNQFPISKSPIKYLYKEYLDEYNKGK